VAAQPAGLNMVPVAQPVYSFSIISLTDHSIPPWQFGEKIDDRLFYRLPK
jgi:hypothetical protein